MVSHRYAVLLALCVVRGAGNVLPLEFGATMYTAGSGVPVYANYMTSHTGMHSYPPYSLQRCTPSEEVVRAGKDATLGEHVFGERAEPTMFKFKMLQNVSCAVQCAPKRLTNHDRKLYQRRIEASYRAHYTVDALPVIDESSLASPAGILTGHLLGTHANFTRDGKTHLNNHLVFTLKYHQVRRAKNGSKVAIVSFSVEAQSLSIDVEECQDLHASDIPGHAPVLLDETQEVPYTYSVKWHYVRERRVTRNFRLPLRDEEAHWFGLVNSMLIVLALSGMLLFIITKLHKGDVEDQQDMSAWRSLHGDVFRAPPHVPLLAVLLGTGAQILCTACVTLFLGLTGSLSFSKKGDVIMVMVLIYSLLGSVAGYVAARLLVCVGVKRWKDIFSLAVAFPAFVCMVYHSNLSLQTSRIKFAPSFEAYCFGVFFWLGIALPLVLTGALIGFRQVPSTLPLPTADTPIPKKTQGPRPWWTTPTVSAGLAALLPFHAIYSDLGYLLRYMWQGRTFEVMGNVAVSLFICVLVSATVAATTNFILLCKGDHRWWWRSFFMGGFNGVYVALFSAYYYSVSAVGMKTNSTFVFFASTMLLSLIVMLATGVVSFYASFAFLKLIYSPQLGKKGC